MRSGREDLRRWLALLPSVGAMQRDPLVGALRGRFENRQIDNAIRKVLRDARDRIRFRPLETDAAGFEPGHFAGRVAALLERDARSTAGFEPGNFAGRDAVCLERDARSTAGFEPGNFAGRDAALLERDARSTAGDLINASGIVFHPRARDRFAGTAAERASRLALTHAAYEDDGRASGLLGELTGAEDALVCRSVAAAFFLAIRALAEGAEVVFSRSQLGLVDAPYDARPLSPVSICGLAGAAVVEAGAANKTRLSDYHGAVGDRTALIVTARPSTCVLRGFTEEPAQEEIVRTGTDTGVEVLHLAGDTTLRPVTSAALPAAVSVAEAVRHGTPLIIAAGGGLIGGPPCGLLIGKNRILARIRGHGMWPAARASRHVRAGLDARLTELAGSDCDFENHPAAHMLAASPDEVGVRARQLLERLTEDGRFRAECSVVERRSHLTTYRLPIHAMPSFAVSIRAPGSRGEYLADRWLKGTPPLLVDCGRDGVRIDMRGVEKNRISDVARIVKSGL